MPFLVAVAAYHFLEHRGQLRLWWAVLIGAVLCALPFVLLSLLVLRPGNTIGGASELLVDDGRLTQLGFWRYFVLQPVIFGSVGAISGLVGWLVAFGPRLAAPLRARPDR